MNTKKAANKLRDVLKLDKSTSKQIPFNEVKITISKQQLLLAVKTLSLIHI